MIYIYFIRKHIRHAIQELRVHSNCRALEGAPARSRAYECNHHFFCSFFSESISVAGKMEGTAYGAGRAGGAFDPLTFLQQPHTVLRMVSWVSPRALLTISPQFFFWTQNNAEASRALGTRNVYASRALAAWCLIAVTRQYTYLDDQGDLLYWMLVILPVMLF